MPRRSSALTLNTHLLSLLLLYTGMALASGPVQPEYGPSTVVFLPVVLVKNILTAVLQVVEVQ